MKLFNISVFLIVLVALPLMIACNEDEGISEGSNLSTEKPKEPNLSELDRWIKNNFTTPYNIEVVYKWQESLIDQNRFLYPPYIDSVQSALNIVNELWIKPYNEVSSIPFVQGIAPRQIVLVGGVNRNPSGTIRLGVAEAGKRITLFNVDLLNKKSRDFINRFIQTIQHEYAHILNQTAPFDEDEWGKITPEGYTAQWFNESNSDSREEGFVSAYARVNEGEDFAEMVSFMLSMSGEEWIKFVNDIESFRAITSIRRKERMVVEYYSSEFNIDMYELQDSVYNATIRLIN